MLQVTSYFGLFVFSLLLAHTNEVGPERATKIGMESQNENDKYHIIKRIPMRLCAWLDN